MPAYQIVVTVNNGGTSRSLRLIKWSIFSCLFALVPLYANVLALEDQLASNWLEVIGRGELFVIAAALLSDGLGRVWGQRIASGIWATLCFGALAFILMSASIEFGWISRELAANKALSEIGQIHIWSSLVVFLASIAASGAAVYMEE